MYSFPNLKPICCSMSVSNCCFLKCIQISQEASKEVWYSHPLKNFPHFVVIYTVKGFGIINNAEVDAFLEAETPTLWLPDAKNWLIWKDPHAEKDWRQEEKGMTEDEMVGWQHWLNIHEFEQVPGVGDGQESLECCRPSGNKESKITEQLTSTEYLIVYILHNFFIHSTVDGHLGCLHVPAIANRAEMNIGIFLCFFFFFNDFSLNLPVWKQRN